jgi:ATP-dependent Clp protease protease subunit
VQGPASDIKIVADQILKTKNIINEILASNTGKDIKKIEEDTLRDYYLTSDEALKYGIVDKVLQKGE